MHQALILKLFSLQLEPIYIQASEAKLSNEARKLLESKGEKMSPDPTVRKPRGQKALPPGHIGHISPPKEGKDDKTGSK